MSLEFVLLRQSRGRLVVAVCVQGDISDTKVCQAGSRWYGLKKLVVAGEPGCRLLGILTTVSGQLISVKSRCQHLGPHVHQQILILLQRYLAL